uniref:BAH domain-containing protein n=1 Tax=Zea mays TaxID=4577 RepID=A0A804MDH7_MAIZE
MQKKGSRNSDQRKAASVAAPTAADATNKRPRVSAFFLLDGSKVHSFVFIMSEEMKRLIAYVEDLYEDTNSCNMVKVQWFDKVDES